MAEFPPMTTQTTNIYFIYYKAERVYLKIHMVLCISHTISILFSNKIHPNEKGSEEKELVNVSKKETVVSLVIFFWPKQNIYKNVKINQKLKLEITFWQNIEFMEVR